MREAIQSGSYRSFDDLHVDEIDPVWNDPGTWLQAGIQSLETAALVRDRESWPMTVAVGFSLEPTAEPQGHRLDSWPSVLARVDNSPPSLYLFDRGIEPWTKSSEFSDVSGTVAPPTNFATRVMLREWFEEEDDEYRSSLWLAS